MVLKRLSLEDLLIEEIDRINQNYILLDECSVTDTTYKNTTDFDIMSQLINKTPTQNQNSTINLNSQSQFSEESSQKENQNDHSLNSPNICDMTTNTDKKMTRKRKVDTSALLELHSQFQSECNSSRMTQSSKRRKSEEIPQSLNSSKVESSQAARLNITSNFNDDDLDLDI